MSGHNKWSQIKHQKGAADAKRSNLFSKLANGISITARGGADPATNFQLKIAIEKAKSANMPKENIQRAIDRVAGSGGAALEEIMFEAYGPEGVAFLIETASDNRNRISADVRSVISKYNGKMAESGAVSYMFEKKGLIIMPADGRAEEIELTAIDAGAEDIDTSDDQVFVYTNPHDLMSVNQKLVDQGYLSEEFNLVWEPKTPIEVTDKIVAERLLKMSEALEELDDVIKIASNFEISQELLNNS